MNCHKVQNSISAYVDGELAGIEMLAIRRHLNECTECNAEYESLLGVKRMFGRLSPKRPTSDLAARICANLDQVEIPSHERLLSRLRKHVRLHPVRIRAAAAGLAVFAALLMIRAGSVPLGPSLAMSPDAWSTQVFAQDRSVHEGSVSGPDGILSGNMTPVETVKADPWLAPTRTMYSMSTSSQFRPVSVSLGD